MVFEFNNNAPIYLQIVDKIKIAIISGELKPGERLPSVRDLAVETKVNPNTMQKAMVELEELELIFTERTNGKFVTNDTSLLNSLKQKLAEELAVSFINNMRNIGFSVTDTVNYIERFKESM